MKLKKIISHSGTHFLLCILGYIAVMGTIAENQSWGRGWIHDLKHYIECRSNGINPEALPDDDSPEILELQGKVERWSPQIFEAFPQLKLEYKNIPEGQNGFLKIIEWTEEFDTEEKAAMHMEIPSDIDDIYDTLIGTKKRRKHKTLSSTHIETVEAYLKSKNNALDRAIAIGSLTHQSCSKIPPDRYFPLQISFVKNIADNLKLKALVEAKQGKVDASFQTLKALQGWGNHFGNIESPSMISSALSTAIFVGSVELTYSKILPMISEDTLDYNRWSELIIFEHKSQENWTRMFRGEWHSSIKSQWMLKELIRYNPRDMEALIWEYSRVLHQLSDPKTFIKTGTNTPVISDHLTRKSRHMLDTLLLGMTAYESGYLRSQVTLRQYELAFILKKIEAEGKNVNSLDPYTLNALPTQIVPSMNLIVDFNERTINAPTGISNPKTITF